MPRILLLVAALLPLAVNFGAVRPYEPIKIMICTVAVAVCAAAVWFGKRREVAALAFCDLDLLMMTSFMVASLATAWSVSPVLSFVGSEERGMGLLFSLVLLGAYGVARFATPKDWRIAGTVAIGVACVMSIYAILQWFGLDASGLRGAFPVYGTTGATRAFATLGHPNFLGAYLATLLPLALLLPRRFMWGVSALMGLGIVVTYSRAAWLAAAVGVGCVLMLSEVGRWKRVIPIAVLGGLVVVGGAWLMKPALLASGNSFLFRLGTMMEWREGSARVRLEEWKFGFGRILDRPILGHGQETYVFAAMERKKVRDEAARGAATPDPSVADRLHNVWLDTAWATGFLGLTVFLLLLLYVAKGLRAMLSRPTLRREAAVLAGSLAAWLLANQVGFDSSMTALASTLIFARIASANPDIL